MTVGLHFLSCRTSIMIGGTLIAIANVINALSTDIRILFASFGIIEGTCIKTFGFRTKKEKIVQKRHYLNRLLSRPFSNHRWVLI